VYVDLSVSRGLEQPEVFVGCEVLRTQQTHCRAVEPIHAPAAVRLRDEHDAPARGEPRSPMKKQIALMFVCSNRLEMSVGRTR
jgi:hypothetical protein